MVGGVEAVVVCGGSIIQGSDHSGNRRNGIVVCHWLMGIHYARGSRRLIGVPEMGKLKTNQPKDASACNEGDKSDKVTRENEGDEGDKEKEVTRRSSHLSSMNPHTTHLSLVFLILLISKTIHLFHLLDLKESLLNVS